MENGQCLLDYLISSYPELETKICKHSVFEDSEEYLRLLHETIIIKENSEDCGHLVQLFEANSYIELVDLIISYLVRENSSNVLIYGYHDPSKNSFWSSKAFNPYVSFQINFLKNEFWNRLFNRIGKNIFVKLVLTNRCYIKTSEGNYLQIFGHLPGYHTKPSEPFMKSRMMYRNKRKLRNSLRLFPDTAIDMVENIIPNESIKIRGNFPKKFRPLKSLCDKLISNDAKFHYLSIYNNICADNLCIRTTNFDHATPITAVIKFVLIAIGKIFPLYTWGTSKNKTSVIDKVIKYIKSSRNDKFSKSQLISSIEISTIYWLGKTSKITSKQDYISRESLFTSFMEWFFSYFIRELVGRFWYVTEASHGGLNKDLLYYCHKKWEKITYDWWSTYLNNYLTEIPDILESKDVISRKFNIGHLRLLPKLYDFRLLCTPIKHSIGLRQLNEREKIIEKFQYLNYMNNIIKPIRELLVQKEREKLLLSTMKHPRCVSLTDIVYHIGLFKGKLRQKYTQQPLLYVLKFDMKHCFDNLDQKRILQSVEKLFEGEDDEKVYFIRQFIESSAFKQELKKHRYAIKDGLKVQEFNMLNFEISGCHKDKEKPSKIILDKTKTLRFTKVQVLDIIREQVLNSIMILPGTKERYFRRKKGVFQGFPLLATLCDLVYNSLVEDNFQFLFNDNSESILLRLVDDFLVISTDRNICEKVYSVAIGEKFSSCGAIVNSEKTYWTDSTVPPNDTIKFIGLKIKPSTLEVIPDANSNSASISLSNHKSFRAVYLYLQWCYKIRLADHFINLTLVSRRVALENIAIILGTIIQSFYTHFKEISIRLGGFDERSFQEFVLELVYISLRKYEIANTTMQNKEELVNMIKSVIITKLQKNPAFRRTTSWLKTF